MLKKIIFFFAWLGIFIGSILGLVYVITPQYLSFIDINSTVSKLIILNVSWIYLFITLLKLSSNFSREKDYVIKNENGSVVISSSTIKTLIADILSRDKEIKDEKIECGNNGKKYFVKINMSMVSDSSIAEKTTDIQNKIKNSLEDKLDLKIDDIEIKISKLITKKNMEEQGE